MCLEVISLHCHAVVMPDDSLLFLKPSSHPGQPSRVYPCYDLNFMFRRRRVKEKTFLFASFWGWIELMICVFVMTTLNKTESLELSWERETIIVVDYCCSLTFSEHKEFMFVCSGLDWWTHWWINQSLLFRIFIDSAWCFLFLGCDGKTGSDWTLKVIVSNEQKNLFDVTVNIELRGRLEDVCWWKSIRVSLPFAVCTLMDSLSLF